MRRLHRLTAEGDEPLGERLLLANVLQSGAFI
jgi:hypothetical protein